MDNEGKRSCLRGKKKNASVDNSDWVSTSVSAILDACTHMHICAHTHTFIHYSTVLLCTPPQNGPFCVARIVCN